VLGDSQYVAIPQRQKRMLWTIRPKVGQKGCKHKCMSAQNGASSCTIQAHHGPVQTLRRSPFIQDVLLSVGGSSFALWSEEDLSGPLLEHTVIGLEFTAGDWSPSRPSVFFLTKSDGSVDVWDVMDTSYLPVSTVSVSSPLPLRGLEACSGSHDSPVYLASGDDDGIVHVLSVPSTYTVPAPNETIAFRGFIDSELRRLTYVKERTAERAATTPVAEPETTEHDSVEDGSDTSESSQDEKRLLRLRKAYAQFQKEEHEFLVGLGLAEEAVEDDEN